MDVTTAVTPTIRVLKAASGIYAVNSSLPQLTEILRHFICETQFHLTVFQYEAAQAHMKFKNQYIKKPNSEKTLKFYIELRKLVNSGFQVFAGHIQSELKSYFKHTHSSSVSPRIGIYLSMASNGKFDLENKSWINILAGNQNKQDEIRLLEEYSIFKNLSENVAYIDNNIPANAETRTYKNAQLDLNRIEDYKRRWVVDSLLISRLRQNYTSKASEDKKWNNMRANNIGEMYPLYKSHLGVPVAFTKHKSLLPNDFSEKLKLTKNNVLAGLVADHSETYYFQDLAPQNSEYGNVDTNVMYKFADILSIAIITKMNFYDCSETINSFENINPDIPDMETFNG